MNKLEKYSQSFKTKYESFLTGCDALESLKLWDLEENGEMDVYFSNDLVSIIIRLIAADGDISQSEVEFLNDVFGFEYNVEELKDIYEQCGDNIKTIFDNEIENGLKNLNTINPKLADMYKELIDLICDIVIESDGVISNVETELAKKLKSLKI